LPLTYIFSKDVDASRKYGAFGSYRDGFELYHKAASRKKAIHVVHGASHYDLYDQPEATDEAVAQLTPFFQNNL
jgi:fermentation-respiration switch protein FrsA (DUF1100 family)